MGDALTSLIEHSMADRAARNVAFRVGQIGAQIAQKTQEPEDDNRFSLVHLNPQQETRALQEYVYARKPLADAPELFYGPFMQLGTKLQLGPKWVQFVVDTVTDPLTYALSGSGGLLAKGAGKIGLTGLETGLMTVNARVARLGSMLGKGAAEIGGKAVLDEAERALVAAGKILGSGEREAMLQAARTGSKEFTGLIDKALAVGEKEMEPGIKASLDAMRKDRKALQWVLDNSDELLGYEKLPSSLIPQKGVFAKIAAGQAEPFVKFAIPSLNPANLTRQLIGIGYEGETFYTPFAKSMMSRGARTMTGTAEGLLTGRATEQLAARRYAPRPYMTGDVTGRDVGFSLDHIDSVLASPLDRPNLRAAEELPIDPETLEKAWKALPKKARETMNQDEFAAKLMGSARRSLMESDQARLATRQEMMDRLAGQAEQAMQPFGPPAPGIGAELAQAGEIAAAQVRRHADMFSLENLHREGSAGDFHLRLTANIDDIKHWGSLSAGQAWDVLIREHGGIAQAQDIDGILRYVIEQPKAWEAKTVNGERRLFLKPENIKQGSLFRQQLNLSKGGSLETFLTTTGLSNEVASTWERMSQTLEIVGKNLVSEKALAGTMDSFWPAVFKRNPQFSRRFGEGIEGWRALTDALLYSPESVSDIMPDVAKEAQRLAGSAKAGKASVQQVRKVVDEARVILEAKGYGTYERSSINTFANAINSYGQAHLERRLLDEFGAITGKTPYEDLPDEIKKLVTARAWNAVDKDGVSHTRDVFGNTKIPKEDIRAAFTRITLRSARPDLEGGAVRGALKEQIPDIAREMVAKEMAGKKQIKVGDQVIRIRAARVREEVPGSIEGAFDAEWVRSKSYPEHLRYRKEIEAEVEARVAAAEQKLSKRIAKKTGEGKIPPRAVIWVRKDLANHFVEPLGLWEQHGLNGPTLSALGRLNAKLKATTLLGDVFHLHSLTMNQLAGRGPREFFKFLLDPQGNLLPGVKAGAFGGTERFARMRQQAVGGVVVGAAAGAGTGLAFDASPGETATLSLTGALYGAALGAARINEAWGKRLALSPDGYEYLHWMGRANWTGRPDDRSIGMFSGWLKDFRDMLMRKYPDSFLISPIDGLKHVNDVWEHELWGTAHNGGKHWLFAATWNDEVAKLEKSAKFKALSAAQQENAKVDLARQVMQFANNAFGTPNVAALLSNPKWMHYARWGLLAPNWTASRIQMASGFYHGLSKPMQALTGAALGSAIEAAEAGFDPEQMTGMGLVGGGVLGVVAGKWSGRIAERLMTKGDVTAKLAQKATATALLAGFATANLLNKALSGHWLWENEEGKKTSIELPGVAESGRKRYLSLGKQWMEAFEFAAISEKDGFAVPVFGRTQSKLSVPVQWTVHMLMNDNRYGHLVTADDNVVDRLGNIMRFTAESVTPIIVQGPARLAGQAIEGSANMGRAAEAAVRFAGFPLSRSPYPMSAPLNGGAFLNAIRPVTPPTLESYAR